MTSKMILFPLVMASICGLWGCSFFHHPQSAMMKEMEQRRELDRQKAAADIAFQEDIARKHPA